VSLYVSYLSPPVGALLNAGCPTAAEAVGGVWISEQLTIVVRTKNSSRAALSMLEL